MLILLDIDGVMIPARPWQSYQLESDGFGVFSKIAVEGLNKIIDCSIKPQIILTTSHKHKFNINEWQNIFARRGVRQVIVDRLPTNSLEVSRIDEITRWYLKNMNE